MGIMFEDPRRSEKGRFGGAGLFDHIAIC